MGGDRGGLPGGSARSERGNSSHRITDAPVLHRNTVSAAAEFYGRTTASSGAGFSASGGGLGQEKTRRQHPGIGQNQKEKKRPRGTLFCGWKSQLPFFDAHTEVDVQRSAGLLEVLSQDQSLLYRSGTIFRRPS